MMIGMHHRLMQWRRQYVAIEMLMLGRWAAVLVVVFVWTVDVAAAAAAVAADALPAAVDVVVIVVDWLAMKLASSRQMASIILMIPHFRYYCPPV